MLNSSLCKTRRFLSLIYTVSLIALMNFPFNIFCVAQVTAPVHPASGSTAGSLKFSVMRYGAHGDGALGGYRGHDDTKSIQDAIDAACSAGGGTIILPSGVFNVSLQSGEPPRPTGGVAALILSCSNLNLVGSGKEKTTISFWLRIHGKHVPPSSVCPRNRDVVSPSIARVWRGSAIYIPGGSRQHPAHNIEIKNVRVTGNSRINGDNRNPVLWDSANLLSDTSSCNAWDTSNKGIYLQNNDFSGGPRGISSGGYYPPTATYFDNIRISNSRIDHFLGELIYEGNRAVSNSSIDNSELDHSNGDCISVAGGWRFESNYCHDVSANGFENSPGTAPQLYQSNAIANVKLDGIAITNVAYNLQSDQEFGRITISLNKISNAGRNGIVLYDVVNANVVGNVITDALNGISLYDMGTTLPAPKGAGKSIASLANTSQFPIRVQQDGSGRLPAGTYNVQMSVVTRLPTGFWVSPPSPVTTISIKDGSRIKVLLSTGFSRDADLLLFWSRVGDREGTHAINLSPANANGSTVITSTANGRIINLPGKNGMILSPNVRNVIVGKNEVIAATRDIHSGIQCCGTPFIRPFLSNVTIQNNVMRATQAAGRKYKIEHLFVLPVAPTSSADKFTKPLLDGVLSRGNIEETK